jgi:hypothetical protein
MAMQMVTHVDAEGRILELPEIGDEYGRPLVNPARGAGERQPSSMTGADHAAVAEEWAIKAIAYNGDLAARTVYDGPCLIRGIEVTTAMSAHASNLTDGASNRYPIPASRAVGIYAFPGAVIFATNCVWAPGSLSAGAILVWYRPLDPSVAWAY